MQCSQRRNLKSRLRLKNSTEKYCDVLNKLNVNTNMHIDLFFQREKRGKEEASIFNLQLLRTI